MYDSALRTFIFTEKNSKRILAIKKSKKDNFRFDGKDWACHEICSQTTFAANSPELYRWSPESGFIELNDQEKARNKNFTLTQKKVQVLISLYANLNLIWHKASPQVSIQGLLNLPGYSSYPTRLIKLMLNERRQLRKKIYIFFSNIQNKLEDCESVDEVNCVYDDLVYNVTLGGYATLGASNEQSGGNSDKNS